MSATLATAGRLLKLAKMSRGLADDTLRGVSQLRAADNVIRGLRETRSLELIGRRFSWCRQPYVNAHNSFLEVAEAIVKEGEASLQAIRTALGDPHISIEVKEALLLQEKFLVEGINVMRTRRGIQGAMESTDLLIDAINAGKIDEIPALINRITLMNAEALKIAEETAASLDQVAILLDREAREAAIRAGMVPVAGAGVVMTADQAQAAYAVGNDDLAAGTYSQVSLDGLSLGLVGALTYDTWLARQAEKDRLAILEAERAGEVTLDGFNNSVEKDQAADDKKLELKFPELRTIPEQKPEIVIPPGDLKKRVVWDIIEEEASTPGPTISLTPKG